MEIVLDTVCLQNLLRRQRKRQRQQSGIKRYDTPLDPYMRSGDIYIALDRERGLISEWFRTCGEEPIKALVSRWEPYGAILMIRQLPRIHPHVNKKLRQLGFTGPIDKLILRISLATRDQIVVSNDKHFWDPSDRRLLGDSNAPVARLCKNQLDVTILLLYTLIQMLH